LGNPAFREKMVLNPHGLKTLREDDKFNQTTF
jgi:hypothetical protein